MADSTTEPLSGYIASEPDTKRTRQGKARFFAFVGKPIYQEAPDGSRTRIGTNHLPLVAYGRVADAAAGRFARGDNFIAEGYSRPYSYEKDGQAVEGKEFVALGIGHDAARTNYEVDRSVRPGREAASQPPAATQGRRGVPDEFTSARASATSASSAIAL